MLRVVHHYQCPLGRWECPAAAKVGHILMDTWLWLNGRRRSARLVPLVLDPTVAGHFSGAVISGWHS
jgi:hypothetical protein